eukprot:SAG31_NODE_3137_length_4632_cov_3.575871_2_plen_68_part_00
MIVAHVSRALELHGGKPLTSSVVDCAARQWFSQNSSHRILRCTVPLMANFVRYALQCVAFEEAMAVA